MAIESIPSEGWLWFVVVVLVLMNFYNVFSTARRNAREAKKEKNQPTESLASKVDEQEKLLAKDKRRLDEHERQLGDMKRGMMVNCAGIQALLEHELHNGNSGEMQTASKEIDKWLRERP